MKRGLKTMINYNNLKVLYVDDMHAIQYIFKNEINDALNDYYEDYEKINPDNIIREAEYIIEGLYNDMLTLINTYDYKIKYDYIIVVAELGLWYGKRKALAKFNTLKDALKSGSYDTNIIYFNNERETLTKESQHHDGQNKYKYYKVVNGKKYAIKYNDLINIAI